jgi:outer membrane receptor protein involved in Fe transport
VTTGWGLGRSRFDVPNSDLQEAAGQDQRQRVSQRYVNATWQRTLSSGTVLHAAGYARWSRSELEGSEADTPLEAHANRTLGRTGVIFAATRQQQAHLLKTGLEWQRLSIDEAFQFAVTDKDAAVDAGLREAALAYTPDDPFRFAGRAHPDIVSWYVQDTWQIASRVTLSGGVRYDRSRLLLDRSQWSPRAGLALRLSERTLVRAAVSRFFQPPQPENLLLSSSPEARVLSDSEVGDARGGADVEPERQWGTEVGLDQTLARRVRMDVTYWRRRIRNAADPNVFAGTTVIFPNAVAKGRAHGVDARIEVTRHHGWSGYASWSYGKVIQTGPVTGGLFLEDEVDELGPGVEFFPDHDQRSAGGAGVSWHADSGLGITLTARYESGTPIQRDDDDDELEARPGAETVDFESGRVRPRTIVSFLVSAPIVRSDSTTLVAGVEVVNLFDRRYAYNFGNPFSGTHFGAPRSVSVTLRWLFD